MKKQSLLYATLSLLVISLGVSTVWAMAPMEHKQGKVVTLDQVHKTILPMSVKSLAAIERAVASGNKEAAQRELNHLKAMLTQIQAVVAQEVGPMFANTKCPIMGSPINPEKVPASLIREYKGQKVAFCCAGCPAQWDKLSDGQKQAKLVKYQAPSSHTSQGSHNH